MPVHFIVMTGQDVDIKLVEFHGKLSYSIGKTMIWFMLITLPLIVFGYSVKDPVAADTHDVDGLNFDIEDW